MMKPQFSSFRSRDSTPGKVTADHAEIDDLEIPDGVRPHKLGTPTKLAEQEVLERWRRGEGTDNIKVPRRHGTGAEHRTRTAGT
ncbi:hypothetical protein ACFRKB_34210 [Streptomyces scopuliridis]|uniref:hypothetical protein n=1 Tax=Streptomyces scopuliridis TaxID=452529 RepID=UPI0036AAE8EF